MKSSAVVDLKHKKQNHHSESQPHPKWIILAAVLILLSMKLSLMLILLLIPLGVAALLAPDLVGVFKAIKRLELQLDNLGLKEEELEAELWNSDRPLKH